ncbi:MAG TPA: hypothetical protein VF121_14675 [Thermoanaerobaculia bacterium]|nr:hypothetical protein [Thermoanaerobaculia bacterium]
MRHSLTASILGLALLCPAPSAFADGYTATVAPDSRVFRFSGGESQSAVVPPGTKSQCPKGRVLVSDDWAPPPLSPAAAADPNRRPSVRWRNIAPPTLLGQAGTAKFFAPPQVAGGLGTPGNLRDRLWMVPGADHQLVALPNGDLVYQMQTASREPISSEWFAFTSRNLRKDPEADGTMPQFGPGARTTLATWISTDCGKTFRYATEIDSFGEGYEECANPQPKAACPDCTVPPLPFDMGGSDGPNLVVDRDSGRLYAIFQCVGMTLTKDAGGAPLLDNGSCGDLGSGTEGTLPCFVNRTYVFSSDDGGKSFARLGFYGPRLWGPQAVVLGDGRLALGIGAGVFVATPNAETGALDLSAGASVAGAQWEWRFPPGTDLDRRMELFIGGNTLLARAPGKKEVLIFGFPSLVEKTKGDPSTRTQGFRLFLHDPSAAGPGVFAEIPAILPTGSPADSAVLHVTALVAVDGGPVLLYWTDLDGATNTARVRGRVLHEGSFGSVKKLADFDIARAGGVKAPFVLTEPGIDPATTKDLPAYFYGDYRTAGAFLDPVVKETPLHTTFKYRYYPVWIQPWTEELSAGAPGGSVRFNEVTVTRSVIKPVFADELLHKEPEMLVGGECCDFMPLFDRGTARLSREARGLRNALLRADPRLRDRALRVSTQPSQAPERTAATIGRPTLSPALREMFEEHEKLGGRGPGGE